jgi:hypothetical protein
MWLQLVTAARDEGGLLALFVLAVPVEPGMDAGDT